MVFGKEAQSHTDRVVASTQEEIRRLARDGNESQDCRPWCPDYFWSRRG